MTTYKFEVSGAGATDIFPDVGVTSQYAPVSRPTSLGTGGGTPGPPMQFNNATASMYIPILAGFA